jgi:hypothetical protein
MAGIRVRKYNRKIAAAKRKEGKAAKLREESKKYTGKKAGAMRTTAARKEKRAGIKRGKVNVHGLSEKQKKKQSQKLHGKAAEKVGKLKTKRARLVGSKKRVATRTKHLTKRITRISKRAEKYAVKKLGKKV